MGKYETIFVIDSLLKTEEIENIITKYEKFISANGGQIELIDRWGKKRLAFEIKKRQYGYYVLILFEGIPSMIKSLEREYRLNESILRYKTIKLTTMALKVLKQQPPVPPKVESVDSTKTADTVADTETVTETVTEAVTDDFSDDATEAETVKADEVATENAVTEDVSIDEANTEIENENIENEEKQIEN